MIKNFLCTIALVALFAVPAEAGVFGSSYQTITNARIQVFDTSLGIAGEWRTAQNGVDFIVTSAGNSASTRAFLSSYGTETGGQVAVNSLDAFDSYVDENGIGGIGGIGGPGNNNGFGTGMPGGAVSSYAFSDTFGMGSLVDSGDAMTQMVASSDISDAGLNSRATTRTGLQAQVELTLQSQVDADFRFVADWTLDFRFDNSGPPAGYGVQTASTYSVSLTGGDPLGGGDIPPLFLGKDELPGLNQNLVNTFYSQSGTIISDSRFLQEEGIYDFGITSTVGVLLAVPEPGTIFGFGAICLLGAFRRRKATA